MFERLITVDSVTLLPPPAQPCIAAHFAPAPLPDHGIAQV